MNFENVQKYFKLEKHYLTTDKISAKNIEKLRP